MLSLPTVQYRLVAWAGPWPVEQRWWAPDRARRVARFQVVTEHGVAHLIGVEQQRWSILATYS
jgi:protein ImuB